MEHGCENRIHSTKIFIAFASTLLWTLGDHFFSAVGWNFIRQQQCSTIVSNKSNSYVYYILANYKALSVLTFLGFLFAICEFAVLSYDMDFGY
tara:strand:- start:122 stop:400 length:279 start_codon:yes stop_codon:yes gene_type:complete